MTNLVGLCTARMPQVGYGTFTLGDGDVESALDWALEAGYRHIDTAFIYNNEKAIGAVIAKWISAGKLKRSDLFVTTKLPPWGNQPERVEKYLNMSLANLGLDYVDQYLVHWPLAFADDEDTTSLRKLSFESCDHVALWREMERMFDEGKAKSIGVSNFSGAQIDNVIAHARIPIAVNQVECHAYFQQRQLLKAMNKHGIKLVAYAPLGSRGRPDLLKSGGDMGVLENQTVGELATKHQRTPAQILLRHLLQLGHIVIPKSANKGRVDENFALFDFELSAEDMEAMAKLDRGTAGRTFDIAQITSDQDITKLKEYPFSEGIY